MADRRKGNTGTPWERRKSNADRRCVIRYPVNDVPVLLAWSGERGFRITDALLQDLSLGGALALTYERPPDEGRIRLSLGDTNPPEWLDATSVQVRKARIFLPGPFLVSLKFLESCPYDFFKSVVSGFDGRVPVSVPTTNKSR